MALDDPSSEKEVCKVIRQKSNCKAPGLDDLPTEIFTLDCPQMVKNLTGLFVGMWSQGCIPRELKDATIIHLYKTAGTPLTC